MKNIAKIFLGIFLLFTNIAPLNFQRINKSYSVNFQWINKSLNINQKYIYPANNRTDLIDNFLGNIFQWAYLNKHATINIWFDSKFTTISAIEATQLLIDDYSSKHVFAASIHLRDIRVFDEVKSNPRVFSDETPVYFRVDLLRAIASLFSIYNDGDTYFVHADLDMKPLSERSLFDNETKEKLSGYGVVMAKSDIWDFENGFMIISNHKPNLHKAMKWILIDLNIARAHEALKGRIIVNGCRHNINGIRDLQSAVYGSFKGMFRYFLHLEEKVKLVFGHQKIPFDREKWGYKMYGLHLYYNGEYSDYRDHTRISEDIAAPRIPTKKVDLPSSTSKPEDNCKVIYH